MVCTSGALDPDTITLRCDERRQQLIAVRTNENRTERQTHLYAMFAFHFGCRTSSVRRAKRSSARTLSWRHSCQNSRPSSDPLQQPPPLLHRRRGLLLGAVTAIGRRVGVRWPRRSLSGVTAARRGDLTGMDAGTRWTDRWMDGHGHAVGLGFVSFSGGRDRDKDRDKDNQQHPAERYV